MDILAHGLWAAAAARTLQRLSRRPVDAKATAAWGIAPDLIAFGPLFAFLLLGLARGELSAAHMADPELITELASKGHPVFGITSALYGLSHSAVVFLAAFGIRAWLLRRPGPEIGGWLLHIVLDIPTHSARFFPTPFLWPVSELAVDGISWTEPWMLAANYGALILAWGWLLSGPAGPSPRKRC